MTTVIMAVEAPAAHGKLYTPKMFRNFSTIPTELFSISCQMIVAVIGATISGKISATLKILEKRLFRLFRSIATPIPNNISNAVLKNA